MWKNLILEIESILKSVGYKLNTPALDTEVQRLRERVIPSIPLNKAVRSV